MHTQLSVRRINTLDQELLSFTNAMRQLGSSIGLTTSARQIRSRLSEVRHLFRDNVTALVENKAPHHPQTERASSMPLSPGNSNRRVPRRKKTSHMRNASSLSYQFDSFPQKLKSLGDELVEFGRVRVSSSLQKSFTESIFFIVLG